MTTIYVPPIKCQGIKTKLVEWIQELVPEFDGIWYEPFMGSGVVGFNIRPKRAVFSDTNPHLVNFYNDLKNNVIDPYKAKSFLEEETDKLYVGADDYYKEVRRRFNKNPNSLDFLFLNRSCFNGMMRFNGSGGFNVPFCKKPGRFAQAYITKITNQIKNIQEIIQANEYEFVVSSFENVVAKAKNDDFVYCDPPYIDRYSDYFNSWTQENEEKLFELLHNTEAKFILSTWHSNKFRENKYIDALWNNFNIIQKEHFYHLGGRESNRNKMMEALVYNFKTKISIKEKPEVQQLALM